MTSFEQRTFETAVSSSASIVKPTVPKNVLAEFEHFAATGNRYKKANPFDDDGALDNRGPAPQPPQPSQPIMMPPPTQQQLPPQPPPPQRPVDFSQFGDFSIKQPPPQQQNQRMDDEKGRLVNAMQQHLRLKAAHGQAMTIGELSAQIRDLTGQSWGGYWESKYGNLTLFLKSNPDFFTVIKSKYVVCKGQEDVALRQVEREVQEEAARIEEQSRMQAQYSSVPIYAQQPSMQTSFYAPSFDDPFGLNVTAQPAMMQPPGGPRDSFNGGEWNGVQSRSNSIASRRDSAEWALPQGPTGASFTPFDPFAPIDPFRAGEAPSYIPHASNQSSMDWWAAPPQPPPAPFNFSAMSETLNTTAQNTSTQNTSGLSAEDEEEIRKAERRAARKAKKQEEADEALARELQSKEFEREQAAQSTDEFTGETLVLTTAQMRDLAEKELGIDNVRIIAGFTVKKYGREGRPHQRKMWVTQSLTHLAWASSLLEGSHRGIELKHVTDVTSGQMTPTIARTTSDKNKVKAQCFSLVTMSRTLDMQACSIIQRDALVNALKAVVDFNHKYKPEKVDRDLTRVRLVGYASIFKSKA